MGKKENKTSSSDGDSESSCTKMREVAGRTSLTLKKKKRMYKRFPFHRYLRKEQLREKKEYYKN
jgi:hypothetical protein